MKKIVILIAMMVTIVGCADLAEDNRKMEAFHQKSYQFVQKHSTDQMKEAVAKRQLVIGMNKAEVWASIGLPLTDGINKTTGFWGVHEQWIYGFGRNRRYLYFENGILTSWQN